MLPLSRLATALLLSTTALLSATAMADDMQRIADEEFQHRDMVRRDRPLYDGTPPG